MAISVTPGISKFQFSDILGYSLPGGKLYTYLSGTTTPAQTWEDASQITLNENPIILDAAGECTIFIDPTVSYTFVLQDAGSVQRWSQDGIQGSIGSVTGIQPNTITTAMIRDGAITAVKLEASLLNTINTAGQQWKNRFFNGEMLVSQRYTNSSVAITANVDAIITDQWIVAATVAGTAQRVVVNVANVPYYGLKFTASTTGSVAIRQNIDSQNIRDIQRDTSGNIVLSAYVDISNLPKTPGWQIAAPTVENNFASTTASQTGSFPQVTVSYQRISTLINISNAAYQNGLLCQYIISLAAGESVTITGCQIETGTAVSSYAYGRPYPLELSLCRYYYNPVTRSQLFTSSGTFNVPSDRPLIYATGCGSGGGGGGASGGPGGGGGGGGGAFCTKLPIAVTPGSALAVTINAGGAGGASSSPGDAGSTGGTTSLAALLSLPGGIGGGGGSVSLNGGAGATAVTAGTFGGGKGGCQGANSVGGSAGGSLFQGAPPGNAVVGLFGGGGGGGNGSGASGPFSGGAGGQGYLLIEW